VAVNVDQANPADPATGPQQAAEYNTAITAQDDRELLRLDAGRNPICEGLAVLDHGRFVSGPAGRAGKVLIRWRLNIAQIICTEARDEAKFSQNMGGLG
jgi:hypothetical protein